jgi:hypothetical protein
MRGSRLYLTVLAAVAAMVVLGAPAASAAAAQTSPSTMCCMGGTHLGGPLYGSSSYPAVRGHAEYQSWNSGRHREFDIDLWNAGKLAGKTLTVYAGGNKIGTVRVGSGGGCHLHHDTANGQYVPTLSGGATVNVKTGTGTLVASGTLHRMM